MTTGRVKFFNPRKGFGFIALNDGSGDVYVHESDIDRAGLGQITAGQGLNFAIEMRDKGARAVNLEASFAHR